MSEQAACRAIVQSLPHAVLLLNGSLRVMLANRAAALLFRVPLDRFRNRGIDEIVADPNIALLLRSSNGRRTKVIETSYARKGRNGATLTLRVTAVRLARRTARPRRRAAPSDTTHASGFTMLMVEDITDKAVLEQQLVETEKQAAMGQLAAGILHEVSNPLSSLGSNLSFVRSSLMTASPQVRQALESSLDHLDQMRQSLGTLSGFPGRAALRCELADVHEVARRSVTFIAKEAERRRVAVSLSFAPSVVACEMDVRLVKQVLLNVLKNALEAMPDGGRLELKTSFHPAKQPQPESLMIAVRDTGMGIADADLRRVFRPLFTTKARGAGLGLSFCRQVIEEHGGEIRLTSHGRNRGTTVTITLPVRQPVIEDE